MEQLVPQVPQWSLGDRLAKARRHASLSGADLADRIGVSRNTVTNYEQEKVHMRRPVLIAWAFACGVPFDWLVSGDTTTEQGRQSNACTTAESPVLPSVDAESVVAA